MPRAKQPKSARPKHLASKANDGANGATQQWTFRRRPDHDSRWRAERKQATCIFCSQTKPLSDFNRGHVLPESFGSFERTFVHQYAECRECNDFSGRSLELPLARDSKEGLDRFQHGVLRAEKKRRSLPSERVKFSARGGPFNGSSLLPDPDSPPDELRLKPARQIGFGKTWDGPFTWYPIDALPPVDELRASGLHIAAPGSIAQEELEALLRGLGIEVDERRILGDPRDSDGKIAITMHGQIDTTLKRAVAKIGFSYLAYHYPDLPLLEQFDGIRHYIRNGVEPQFEPVAVEDRPLIGNVPPEHQLIAHGVTVHWDRSSRRVVAQVTLFGWVTYRITLSVAPFLLAPFFVESGHAFNPYARQVCPLTRDRRLSGTFPLMSIEEFRAARGAR